MVLCEYGIASILCYIYTYCYEASERLDNMEHLLSEAIYRVFHILEKYVDSMGAASDIMRPNLYPYLFGMSVVLLFFVTICFVSFDSVLQMVLLILVDCVIVIGGIGISLVPWMMNLVECRAPRTAHPCLSLASVIFICIPVLCKKYGVRRKTTFLGKIITLLVSSFLVVYLFVQWSCSLKFFEDRYARNAIDSFQAIHVKDRIETYEKDNGTQVTKLCIYHDKKLSCNYFTMWSDSSRNPYAYDFSDVEALSFFLGRIFERGERNEEYASFFSENDWNSFYDEQFIFEGDTLHLCIF